LVRIFAAYIVVTTVHLVPSLWVGAEAFGSDEGRKLWALAILMAPLVASVLMWSFHLSIAKYFFAGDAADREIDLKGSEYIETALFSVVGLWFVLSGFVDLAYWMSLIHIASSPNWSFGVLLPDQKANFAATLVEFAIGLVLLIKSVSLQALLAKIRG